MFNNYDIVVIGGGIYGAHVAMRQSATKRIAIIESGSELMQRASKVNSARLHTGAHYLRAPRTAEQAKINHDKFFSQHDYAINRSFQHHYGIARHDSLTDDRGFERFCEWKDIRIVKNLNESIFDRARIQSSYLVPEFSFDPILIAKYYKEKLNENSVRIYYQSEITTAEAVGDHWNLTIIQGNQVLKIRTPCVVNSTYANLSAVNEIFGLPGLSIKHELSEVLLAYIPKLKDIGATVMDGPFLSVIPYGKSKLHVVTSVVYTHHDVSLNSNRLTCQEVNLSCSPNQFMPCNSCSAKPRSFEKFMKNQLALYLQEVGDVYIHNRMSTIKSTWNQNDYRDERITTILKLNSKPNFFATLSGKVSNIYELDGIEFLT
jgi:hypothetical protein